MIDIVNNQKNSSYLISRKVKHRNRQSVEGKADEPKVKHSWQ